MARLYQCDRCGKQFTTPVDLRDMTLPHLNYHQNEFTDETDGYTKEICAPCARDMKVAFDAVAKLKLGN